MNTAMIRGILKDTDFVHTSGSKEELQVAEYLKSECEKRGAKAFIEPFPVEMAEVTEASFSYNGIEIPCTGFRNCGSAEIEAPFLYLPNTDPASLSQVGGKIVLLDSGVGYFLFQDLVENGAVGIVTYNGNVRFRDRDIDDKELRKPVRGEKDLRLPAVNIHAKDAFRLVKAGPKTVKIKISGKEYPGESRNVICELPGTSDEWIVMTAHYDTTPLSHGSYDNMTGCIALLHTLDVLLEQAPHRYGVRFIFCGSEERGLLGSHAYVDTHEEELKKIVLNVNIDMVGSVMGRFISCVSAEEALASYIKYEASMKGFGIAVRQGVYSSDSTPFADKGVPAVSFARMASSNQATIHNRYDTPEILSAGQILTDSQYIAEFTKSMADAVKCPVNREIPERVKKELDEYLNRKRREF